MGEKTYSEENSGILFVNHDRRPDKQDPDKSGSLTAVCPACEVTTKFWLSAWTKTIQKPTSERKGEEIISLSIKPVVPKDGSQGNRVTKKPAPKHTPGHNGGGEGTDLDDDIQW